MGLADLLVGGASLDGKVAQLFAARAADGQPGAGRDAHGAGDGADASSDAGSEAKAPAGASGERAATLRAQAKEDPEKLSRTVFVGNVSTSTTAKVLKRAFTPCGSVASVRIRSVAFANKKMSRKGAVISKAFDQERKDTYNAYVVFVSVDAVPAALAMNGTELDGKTLRVDRVRRAHARRVARARRALPALCRVRVRARRLTAVALPHLGCSAPLRAAGHAAADRAHGGECGRRRRTGRWRYAARV